MNVTALFDMSYQQYRARPNAERFPKILGEQDDLRLSVTYANSPFVSNTFDAIEIMSTPLSVSNVRVK